MPVDVGDLAPRCVTHGEMRYRFAGDWWVCPGWDGEGCCALTAEQAEGWRTPLTVRPDLDSPPSQWGFRRAVITGAGRP